jgi:hypothetical protein
VAMIIERVDLQTIKQGEYISLLHGLEIGESIYCTELKQAQSLRALSYYLVKTRNLARKYTFRKMDRGWRIIRIC